MTALIVWPGPDAVRPLVGGKAASLNALGEAGLSPPAWCALVPAAFQASAADGDLENLAPAPEVVAAIQDAARKLAPDGAPLAVRSSGVDEDAAGHSFAGQFDSFLDVAHEDLPARVADVWRSGFSERVRAYRAERGLPAPGAPAVILQRMVKAAAAGVAFSADPVTGEADIAVVAAVEGLGDRLVHGEAAGDAYRVNAAGEVVSSALEGDAPVLADAQIAAVAKLARNAEAWFGAPQDVEWAIEAGEVKALQSRAITTLALGGLSRILWDNSNIVESYPGVTTPLTFTFARRAYEAVYRQLARVLGVSQARVDANAQVFADMIGLVEGRIYYNLLNWYRALALLPGFALTRKAMEQMMGVDRALPPSLAQEIARRPAPSLFSRVSGAFALATAAAGLVVKRFGLKGSVRRFHAQVDRALAGGPDLARAPYDALAAEYNRLEDALLARWTPPLVNDLWCMIAFGAAKKLAQSWAGDEDGGRLNAALVDQGGVISAEPVRRITEMGRLARETPDIVETLASRTPAEIAAALTRAPALKAAFESYLDTFGDRCTAELKLESETLNDDPTALYRAVAASAARPQGEPEQEAFDEDPLGELLAPLANKPFKRVVLRWAAREAAARIRDRENMRFERTRVFGRVRRLFVEMGGRLADAGKLADARDVFFLTFDEVVDAARGAAPAANLRALADARRASFDAQRAAPPPPRRFESVGALGLGLLAAAEPELDDADLGEDARRGLGCCPGIITGRARVVRDPAGVTLSAGDVLVAEFTDPGWVTLFAQASGLIVERGSMLSHSAIVAREIGLPAVVGLADACAWIKDGEEVTLNGATGVVRTGGETA